MLKICCFDDVKCLAQGLIIPETAWITILCVFYTENFLHYYAILWSLIYIAYIGLELTVVKMENKRLIASFFVIRPILAICSEGVIIYHLYLHFMNKK